MIYQRDDVQTVLSAGGDVASPSSAAAVNMPAVPAFRGAVEMLLNPAALAQRQRDDAYLAQLCKDLSADRSEAGGDKLKLHCTCATT